MATDQSPEETKTVLVEVFGNVTVDPALIAAFKLVFDLANEAGLNGMQWTDFDIVYPEKYKIVFCCKDQNEK